MADARERVNAIIKEIKANTFPLRQVQVIKRPSARILRLL